MLSFTVTQRGRIRQASERDPPTEGIEGNISNLGQWMSRDVEKIVCTRSFIIFASHQV